MNKKNYGKSVRAKLINLMNDTGYRYMYLLARYFNERLLYRISVSRYSGKFLLKGGFLLYALHGLETRPTVDIDLLANYIDRDQGLLTDVFKEILSIKCDEDGVIFDAGSLRAEPIAVGRKYPGTRLIFTAHLDTIVHSMSIDIAFGDVVVPSPLQVELPLLLKDIPSVCLRAYSIETVIAEKFHAMLDRDVLNSRMKDFFDCYQMLTSYDIDSETLYEAIRTTFDNRRLEYLPDRKLFTESFAMSPERNTRWNAFLKKIQWHDQLPFPVVMQLLKNKLQPFEQRYWRDKESEGLSGQFKGE